jgi:hypothetical protein
MGASMERSLVEMERRFQSQELLINELRREVREGLLRRIHLRRAPHTYSVGGVALICARTHCRGWVVAVRRRSHGHGCGAEQVEEGKHRTAEMMRLTATLPPRVTELESTMGAKATEMEVRHPGFLEKADPRRQQDWVLKCLQGG